METIGSILYKLRLSQNLSLDAVSQQTNIAPHLLQYLEKDDFGHLPACTFTKGFICSYAKVVGLPSDKALAIFRRDFTVSQSGKIMPKGLAEPMDKKTFITSKVLTFGGIVVSLCLFTGYLFYQFKSYQSAPKIEIIKPKAYSIVKGPNIPVQGFVSADSVVYVNGNLVEVYPTGEFKAVANLPPGEHSVEIKAISTNNKSSDQQIPVKVIDK
ncbi:hypothetical protein COX08_03930 [Candidatus Beckwithbacteria bacterium CG23_combo_of_CG06-09_8_20_14_all_34_8]|uniref:HTH cro/C1-type domain-containing protein n=1 Tax=Candidatus Beckwithbacteria bacterium CG23_combo_of_CG06-09_8_20_14_all_34_8 TaxID=1974497 RepID=A0A2H0B5J8_9BACT|nr:MAG: hypothetical protein COX08_03930 [Candidatus Beckwithbacteria bacterium CG23_combo_of_CG06-09_8_20_14_all_34_8]